MDHSAHDGIVLVDKPEGITSHDVVARARKAYNTRKIGHAGTLDPMATGLLVLGVDGCTRLLHFIVGVDKSYTATIRLGASTVTDDAMGEVRESARPEELAAVTADRVREALGRYRGHISQIPSSVSAIKVDGKRAYDRVRAGQDVALKARDVEIKRFDLNAFRFTSDGVDCEVRVDCSSGTYIRALARDLGADLAVGGHLIALRRTRVGPFRVDQAHAIDQLASVPMLSAAEAASAVLGPFPVSAAEADDLRHGRRLSGSARIVSGGRAAAIDPSGKLVGIVHARGDDIKSEMNMPEQKK